jgi:hypothetical protein
MGTGHVAWSMGHRKKIAEQCVVVGMGQEVGMAADKWWRSRVGNSPSP